MATYLADKVIVFDGEPAKKTYCTSPEGMVSGMNRFLKIMDITFRRDPVNFRPRINKFASQKDQEQKAAGNYFLMETSEKEKEEEEGADKGAKKKDGAKAKPVAEGGSEKPAKKAKAPKE